MDANIVLKGSLIGKSLEHLSNFSLVFMLSKGCFACHDAETGTKFVWR